jgi:hypothetical protein
VSKGHRRTDAVPTTVLGSFVFSSGRKEFVMKEYRDEITEFADRHARFAKDMKRSKDSGRSTIGRDCSSRR